MTFHEALKAGYHIYDRKVAMGYVSKNITPKEQSVKVAGGSRKGELYVELYNPYSTQFLIRAYIKK